MKVVMLTIDFYLLQYTETGCIQVDSNIAYALGNNIVQRFC